MRLKMISPYDHFPKHNAVSGEPYIACYNDFHVKDILEPNPIALLIEPRSLQPSIYAWMEEHHDKFKLIFTHDSILLSTLPNARHILYGGVWDWLPDGTQKSKAISFCSSDKEMCYLHKVRKQLAFDLESEVDCMGTYNGGRRATTYEIYGEYKFSIVLENYIDDLWFTEKICNAFANKCIPIYYGARDIGRFFDKEGIIQVRNLYELPKLIRTLKYDINWEYGHRNQAIYCNYQRVKQFELFEDWFFDRYEGELDQLPTTD